MPSTLSEISTELKSAIYLSVAKMVEQSTRQMNVSASPSFVASLIELVYNQIILLGEDLEAFATHAGRDVVNTSDVYMATRRNETLTNALKYVHESMGQVQAQAQGED